MPTVNLASLKRVAELLPDRNVMDGIADHMLGHLASASAMIENRTGLTFDAGETIIVLDTHATTGDRLGAVDNGFARRPRSEVQLPLTGPLSGLQVQYRGDYTLDEDFMWSDVDTLVENTDYVYYPETGRIVFQFQLRSLLNGVRVTYAQNYASTPEILSGTRKLTNLSTSGIDTNFEDLQALLTGIQYKPLSRCASLAVTQPALEQVTLQPPTPMGMHELRVYAPQNGAMVNDTQAVTLQLYGVDGNNAETLLSDVNVVTPIAQNMYSLKGVPTTLYTRYILRIVGTIDTTLTLSLLDPLYADAEYSHLQGSVSRDISEACAMLAVELYRNSSEGGSSDGDATIGNSPMTPAIKQLLSGHGSSGVTMI